jgi:hypothetical protein
MPNYNANANVNDLNAGYFRAVVLRELGAVNDKNPLDYLMEQDGIVVVKSELIPHEEVQPGGLARLRPRMYFCQDESTNVYIFIGGCESAGDGQYVWNQTINTSANEFGLNGGPFPSGAAYYGAASAVRNYIAARYGNYGIMRICGYSAGGAIAQWAARQNGFYRQANDSRKWQVISFGSPKCVAPNYQPSGFHMPEGYDEWRWMVSDDPVPVFFPPLSTGQRMLAGLSVFQGRLGADYRQIGEGTCLMRNGTVSASWTPNELSPDPVNDLRNWIAQADQGTVTTHAIATYAARFRGCGASLQGNFGNDTTPGVVPVPGSHSEPGQSQPRSAEPSLRDVARAMDTVSTTIYARHATIAGEPVQIPQSELLHAVREGRVWYVVWKEQKVVCGPKKKSARQVARFGNALLRSLQNKGGMDRANFLAILENYLIDAVEGGPGFEPAMLDGIS